MYKPYFGARIDRIPDSCWDISISLIHEWATTYLCVGLIKYQLLIGRLCRWEDD